MLDALLIQISTSYIHINVRSTEPQLGLYYIAEYACSKGFNVKVKQYSSSEPIIGSIDNLLKQHNCKIVGFYVDSENTWIIRRVLPCLKRNNPDVFAIIGGPQVTGDAKLALKRIPHADYAIIGEGEIPFTELISQIKCKQFNLTLVKGLAYVDASGAFVYNGGQPQSKNLDHYAFPRRKEYSLDDNLEFAQISTGRGCIGQCAFCFEGNKTENKLRLRNTDNVIEEIDYVISNLRHLRYITFLDDTFIIDPNRTETICNHLINKYNGKIGWFCEARVDILIRNLHLLPLMKKAGLIRIQLGGESGNQKVLDAYRKQIKLDQLRTVVKEIYKAGIPSIYVNFIVGGAFETLETFNDTIEFAKELMEIAPGCVEVGSSLLSPYVGTPIRDNPNLFGLKILDKDSLTGPDGFVPLVETDSLSEYKINQLKSIFDVEIDKKAIEILINNLSFNVILSQYIFERDYSMETYWYTKSQEIESYKNYFEPIAKFGYFSILQLSKEDLLISVPFRTCQPISDGEFYYRKVNLKLVKNTPLENAVYLLSAGKISYFEILDILSRSEEFKDIDKLEQQVYEIYLKFDSERNVVWKRDY